MIGRYATMLVALLLAAAASAQDAALIPRDVFFGNPERANVSISPDGAMLAYLAPSDGVLNVWVEGLDGRRRRPVTSSTERPIRSYFWAASGRQIIYLRDEGGDENHQLVAVNVSDGSARELTPASGVQARPLAIDRKHPDEILVAVNDRVPQFHDVWRINTVTGAREQVFVNDQGFIGMIADSDFRVRVGTKIAPDGGLQAFILDDDYGEWVELGTWGMSDALTSGPLGFSRDAETLYITDSRGRDTGALFALNVAMSDDRWRYEFVAAHDLVDIGPIVSHPETGEPQAVGFDYLRREWTVLDESIRADWEVLEGVADGEMAIESRDDADAYWVVSYERDDGPVEYYIYDRERNRAEFLFASRPELSRLGLARMEPVVIPARDGLPLVSYLTRPRGSRGPGPMVLFVHGGPWARDHWGYNPIHQWLANRGYAVLSVNFRGSTGFGKSFVNAGNREWAGTMHDDLLDAVDWAAREGVADPERIAIMGGSYGGYATLVGLAFTPDVFAAGVDIVGPSHVATLLESIPPYWAPLIALFESRVGSLDDRDHLDSISPLTRVDAINKPLLIGQGHNDPRVKVAESEQIVAAMEAKSLPVTYVVFPDEGHGFARPANSMAFFAITEAFLARHLGGRSEAIDSAVRASSAEIPAGADLIPGLRDQ